MPARLPGLLVRARRTLGLGYQLAATQLTKLGEAELAWIKPSPEFLSVYGTLLLTGSMAAARDNDRATSRTFLGAAEESAKRLGRDGNHLWTAFGPTNVAIHRVATAAELGDVQVAIDLGPQIDTTPMPMERRVPARSGGGARVRQAQPARRGTGDATGR